MSDNTVRYVEPDSIGVDEMNERASEPDISDLVESVNETGVVQPPLVREAGDGEYTAVVGQRRVRAAQAAANVDEIPVVVMDWSDTEALKASITENIGLFRQEVSMTDRAEALQTLWEKMGGSGVPVNSHLASELGVPRTTVRTWLEPLHEDWKGTSIDPRSDTDDSNDSFFDGDTELGERSLAEVRRMTGGGEDGEQVAKAAVENDLTQPELQEAKELVEEADADPYEAIQQMAADEDDNETNTNTSSDDNRQSTPHIEATVTFDSTTSIGVREYADRTDQSADEVIAEAVHWFLDAEGMLPDEDTDETDTTPGFEAEDTASTTAESDENDTNAVQTKTLSEKL